MGRFWVAMVDPGGSSLNLESITLKPENAAYAEKTIGEGFYATADTSTLPLRDMNGSSLGQEGSQAFSADGGFAVVFSEFPVTQFDLTFQGISGDITVNYSFMATDAGRPLSGTPNVDHYINGFSVIEYGGFNGSTLTNVRWGVNGHPQGQPKMYMKEASDEFQEAGGAGGGDRGQGRGEVAKFDFLAKRCFITKYQKGAIDAIDVEEARIFVIPISVSLGSGSGSLFEDYFSFQFTPDLSLIHI